MAAGALVWAFLALVADLAVEAWSFAGAFFADALAELCSAEAWPLGAGLVAIPAGGVCGLACAGEAATHASQSAPAALNRTARVPAKTFSVNKKSSPATFLFLPAEILNHSWK